MADDLEKILSTSHMWRTASPKTITDLAQQARVQSYAIEHLLVEEGSPADEFGIVLAGKVRIFHLSADGRRFSYEDLGRDESFGTPAVLSGGRYPASVEALTPATVAWFRREAAFAAMDAEPELARAIVADLARRVVTLTDVARTLARDVPSRLAGYLFQRALAGGEATERGLLVELDMSKTELAEALGTVPETLSRALAKLREAGVIEVEGAQIRILDVGALARSSSGYEKA